MIFSHPNVKIVSAYAIMHRNLQQFDVFVNNLSIDESMVPCYVRTFDETVHTR